MARWARRARQMGITAPVAFRQELPRVLEEASRSADDLQMTFASQGVSFPEVPFDAGSLRVIEQAYRQNHASLRDIELVERLMALFLGEVVVRLQACRWAIYPGRYLVFSPVVVELAEGGLYAQPFLLCSELAKKPGVAGARDGEALSVWAANLRAHATK